MIKEQLLRRFILSCDKCGTGYCGCGGPYFVDRDEMMQGAIRDGWKISHYDVKCPDCD